MAVQGTTTDAFKSLKEILQKNLDNGDEVGAAIYVNLDGKPVVDIWGGLPTRNAPTLDRKYHRQRLVNHQKRHCLGCSDPR